MASSRPGLSAASRSGAVPEAPFWLEINGRRAAAWSCSPEHLEALAIGWLLAEGYIEPGDAVPELEVVRANDTLGTRVRLAPARVAQADAERRHRVEHGCGLAHFVACEPARLRRDGRMPAIPPDADFPSLFRMLYAAAERHRETGGVHSAALTDGHRLYFEVSEVGRHNAVDKVIGRALRAGQSIAALGLVLTARVSGEIALKAARSEIRWIASRSVPTTLALEIASVAGISILARAAGREPRLHEPVSAPEDGAAPTEAAR